MKGQTISKVLLLLFILTLTACFSNLPTNDAPENTTIAPFVASSPTVVSAVAIVSTETVTHTPTSLAAPTPQATETPQPTSPPGVVLRAGCPALLDSDTPLLWTTGSVLFESERDLWAISANSTTPQLVYMTDDKEGYFDFYTENGASKILIRSWMRPDEFFYLVFDLSSRTEMGLPVVSPLPLIPIDGHSVTWLADNQTRFLVNIERVYGVGETRTFQIIDPVSGEIETVTEELKLPGYIFYNDPAYVGVASVDPTNQVVLYTVRSEEESYTFALVLRHLETGMVLWQQEGSFWTYWRIPAPYWDEDGSRVLFSSENIAPLSGFSFLSISRHGESQLLPQQP